MRWLTLLVLALSLAVVAGSASNAQNAWYYCSITHRYYPYTQRCPVPWRIVQPSNPGSSATSADAPPQSLGGNATDDTLKQGCEGLRITSPGSAGCRSPAPQPDDLRNTGGISPEEKSAGNIAYNNCLARPPSNGLMPGSGFTFDSPAWVTYRQNWRAQCDDAERNAVIQFRNQAQAQSQQQAAVNLAQDEQQRAIEKAKSRGYEFIATVKDLILDGKDLAARNAKVQITGIYKKLADNSVLYASPMDAYANSDNYMPILTDDAARPVREALMGYACQNFGCTMNFGGHMTMCKHINLLAEDYPDVPCLHVEVQIIYRPGD